MPQPPADMVFTVVDLLGVFVAATLGAEVAAHKRLDPFGFMALALVSGLGGGVVRDVLIAHGPPRAITEPAYLIVALLAAAIALVFNLQGHRAGATLFTVFDALAVAFWGVAGSQRALDYDLGVLPALLLGVVTAVGGGVIRDVLVGERPMIFVASGSLYATAALAAGAVNVGLTATHVIGNTVATIIAAAVGFTIRLLSLRYGWDLPEPPATKRRPG